MHSSYEFSVDTDVNHLGVLIGNPKADRIIAVSTSAVFKDKCLIPNFWRIDDSSLDSGFQGHMYTRPNDVLVVRSPELSKNIPEMVRTAIHANFQIWKSLTGIQLTSAESRVIISCDAISEPSFHIPDNLSWTKANLQDAAASQYKKNGSSFLAFVLNYHLIKSLGIQTKMDAHQASQVESVSLLMDKNSAMEILQNYHINCAKTYSYNGKNDVEKELNRILDSGRYVFKPSGGAAGIGLYNPSGNGATSKQIQRHLRELKTNQMLPDRFQIQQFLPGVPYGVSAGFDGKDNFEIFEIHQQIIRDGKFIGGRWTPAIENKLKEKAVHLYSQLSDIDQLSLIGLICLDLIGGKIIEVNPRLTASAPISHMLRLEKRLSNHIPGNFKIRQIDLNTRLNVSYELIKNGSLSRLIKYIYKEFKVLVLPQGLNPFGNSRFIFINDDQPGTAQNRFINRISNTT